MRPSKNAVNLIKAFESCCLQAYPDPVNPSGLPVTIGWGHTGSAIHLGDLIRQESADFLLQVDCRNAAKPLAGLPLNQNQFDALVSFIFNLGAKAFNESSLKRLILRKDYASAAEEFLRWTHGGGHIVPGLVRRREAERALFLTPVQEKT